MTLSGLQSRCCLSSRPLSLLFSPLPNSNLHRHSIFFFLVSPCLHFILPPCDTASSVAFFFGEGLFLIWFWALFCFASPFLFYSVSSKLRRRWICPPLYRLLHDSPLLRSFLLQCVACIYVYMHSHTDTFCFLSLFVLVFLCLCVCICIYMYICVYVCGCACLRFCLFGCLRDSCLILLVLIFFFSYFVLVLCIR